VFYLITTRLILSPVRALRETAEIVREGNLATRSDIQTGDEFEELSDTFNQMLENLTESQNQLQSINTSLDLKVNELAERNVALFESNKLKGEFLANVSHELRTPLNSIIGFTELLLEAVEKEAEAGDDSSRLTKRKRYLENIHNAGRSLLEMINGLLDMAKIDAGKMAVTVAPVSLKDMAEGWIALFRPLADRGGIELVAHIAPDVPVIETDAEKLQQIVVNLLSNAVKFTSEKAADERTAGGTPLARVSLRVERLVARGSDGAAAEDRIRISVLDTGPGIAPEDQKKIFEKFQQLDSGHTRRHAGTGLGLAICKDLTGILQGELQLESEVGRGSMFSVILPLTLDRGRAAEMRLEMAFRGQLAAQQRVER
jgi:signal transduction histidine kinase